MDTFTTEVTASGPQGVTIAISGHIDSKNASSFEESVKGLRANNQQGALTLDAAALDYIASAGLRTIMRLLKMEPSLSISNTSPEVYNIFEMTGFTDFLPVRLAAR